MIVKTPFGPFAAPVSAAPLPSPDTLLRAAFNPSVAMANDFTRSLQRDPSILTNPMKLAHASWHAGMVGMASAMWTWSALTQPVGVTAGLLPRRTDD